MDVAKELKALFATMVWKLELVKRVAAMPLLAIVWNGWLLTTVKNCVLVVSDASDAAPEATSVWKLVLATSVWKFVLVTKLVKAGLLASVLTAALAAPAATCAD